MPKPTRSAVEVESIKKKILDTALAMMCDDGFDVLSMRKLALRLGMTAANIYNYYKNKDELYLVIQTNGFQMLCDRFQEIAASPLPDADKPGAMMRAYVDFGISNPDYYEIMFSRNTPKYEDYKNTPMELAATIEKQTALRVAEITTQAILSYGASGTHPLSISASDAGYLTIALWSALHGIVNLHNSRVLQEVDAASDTLIDRLIRDLLDKFLGIRPDTPIGSDR
ncbi:MAG: TetR/AcrR family transcriptional regulator [Desulfosalsimonadaceae bacterium]|nr:TetR/AcrR family transcriptional regulator [Desulfosalsimonadaceae bacterium]